MKANEVEFGMGFSVGNMKYFVMALVTIIALGEAEKIENNIVILKNEGKIQYNIIIQEAHMPRYGECYQNSLNDLHIGCSELTDEVQSRLALSLTNCYLLRFGWPIYPCGNHQALEECMEHMDARAASIYSAMLTNTLAMCHFLQSQAWHQATNNAIHSLTSTSEAVSSQLSEAVESAAALKQQLDSQLLESREALQTAFSEMRESTAEQRNLIIDVFDRVTDLQALVMGEFTWFYSVIFYVSCVFVSLIMTSTPRTISARLPLLAVLTCSLIVERIMTSALLPHAYSQTLQENIYAVGWRVRHICILLCIFTVIRAAFKYRDPVAVTAARLEELASATAEIKKIINSASEKEIVLSTSTLASLACVYDESASSDDTYDPSDESDIEECNFSLTTRVTKSSACERYYLRKRPDAPFLQNPIVALESPEAFERIVKRRESLTRHRSRFQVRQYSILEKSSPMSDSEEICHLESKSNVHMEVC